MQVAQPARAAHRVPAKVSSRADHQFVGKLFAQCGRLSSMAADARPDAPRAVYQSHRSERSWRVANSRKAAAMGLRRLPAIGPVRGSSRKAAHSMAPQNRGLASSSDTGTAKAAAPSRFALPDPIHQNPGRTRDRRGSQKQQRRRRVSSFSSWVFSELHRAGKPALRKTFQPLKRK